MTKNQKTNAIRILERHQIDYDLIHYTYDPENLSVEKIAQENDLPLETIFKTLVAKGNKTGVMVAVIPGNKSLDYKTLAKASSNKKVTLVPLKEIQNLTGYIRGGCSPIGMKKAYPVFIDTAAMRLEKIYINAGARGLLIGIKSKDLQVVSKAQIESITTPT